MFIKVATTSIGLVFLASPLFASALSADVQSKIDALLVQIKELQALIVKLQGGTTSTSCVTLSNTLTLGSRDTPAGNDVTSLQKYLITKGYLDADNATGYFGFLTAQAVGKMQIALGLLSSESDPAYGFAGPKTRAAITCRVTPTEPIVTWPQHCPVLSVASCPTGQHYEYGAITYDSRNCPVTPRKCVADSNTSASATCSISATPNPASFGQTVTLAWTSKNAVSAQWQTDTSGKDNIAIPAGIPGTSGSAYITANVLGNPYITLRVYAANGTTNTCTATFNVPDLPPDTTSTTPSITVTSVSSTNIGASYTNLPKNSQIRFVYDATEATDQPFYSQSTMVWSGGSGSLSIPIPNDLPGGTYYLRVTDYYNSNTTIAESSSFSAGANVQTNPVAINSFAASPASVTSGKAVLFTWSSNLTDTDISHYDGGCNIEGITQNNVALNVTSGLTDASGSVTYVPPATATYTLRCYSGGKDGSPSASRQITVNVNSPQTDPVVISSFTASAGSVASGQPVTFSWDSNLTSTDISYGGSCSISALTSYNQQVHITNGAGASGSVTYTPALTATYTLYCYSGGKDGSPMDTKQVTVSVQ